MRLRTVIRPVANLENGFAFPSTSRTVPSGDGMMCCSSYGPGAGGANPISSSALRPAATNTRPAATASRFRTRLPVDAAAEGHLQRLGAELHVVGAPQLLLGEIDLECRRQLLAVPLEPAHELLVVLALLVPVGEQRRGDVDALPIPALRDHVDLLAGDLLVRLHGLGRVGQIEVARLAVHERVDPQALPVSADADVDGERDLRRVANVRDGLRLPLFDIVLLDEPQ